MVNFTPNFVYTHPTPVKSMVKYSDCTNAEGYDAPPNECLDYVIKQSDGVARVLEILGMLSTTSLLLLPGPLWQGVVASNRFLGLDLFGGFYGISNFVGYSSAIHFYVNNLFFLKQFSLA